MNGASSLGKIKYVTVSCICLHQYLNKLGIVDCGNWKMTIGRTSENLDKKKIC